MRQRKPMIIAGESPMPNTALAHKLDYDDYAAIPPDGRRWEILDGDPYVTPAPGTRHQRISRRLQRQLEDHLGPAAEVFNAPTDVILTQHDIVQPDLVVVANPDLISDRAIEGAPLLVVEILSPSSRRRDCGIKRRRYAALGIPHYWIVDPKNRRIECFRAEAGTYRPVVEAEGDTTLEHPDWPDMSIDLAVLWK